MKLIVTADDFGRSPEINAAVIAAHRQGILTAASLMVAGDAFDQAVELARATPTLAVGLHVVVVDGRAVLPHEKIPLLVDRQGFFADAPARVGLRYHFSRAARRQLEAELLAQFERFAATGLALTHVDGHQHLHLHPTVFDRVVPLAERFGARGIRVVADDISLAMKYDASRPMARLSWHAAFGGLRHAALRRLRRSPLAVAQRVYGLMQTGDMNERYTTMLLNHLQGESAEVYFHPTAGSRQGALGPNGVDLQTLLSPAIRQVVERRSLRLCSYADLREGRQA